MVGLVLQCTGERLAMAWKNLSAGLLFLMQSNITGSTMSVIASYHGEDRIHPPVNKGLH